MVSGLAWFPTHTHTNSRPSGTSRAQETTRLRCSLRASMSRTSPSLWAILEALPWRSRSRQRSQVSLWPGLGVQGTIWVKANIRSSFDAQRVSPGASLGSAWTQANQLGLSPDLRAPSPPGQAAPWSSWPGARSQKALGLHLRKPGAQCVGHGLRGDLYLHDSAFRASVPPKMQFKNTTLKRELAGPRQPWEWGATSASAGLSLLGTMSPQISMPTSGISSGTPRG